MHEQELTIVSLFAGAGGFDWGFSRAGFHTKLACELESAPSKTFAENFRMEITRTPMTDEINDSLFVIQGDVRAVDFSAVKHFPDVLIGGPPCQDFSVSRGRERLGLDGGRGKLYVEFIHGVMFLQPKAFVFENVPGLISANNGKVYETILDDLQNLEERRIEALTTDIGTPVPTECIHGYDILFSGIVDGPHIGVPQTRRRLIIIGLRRDLTDNLRMFEFRKLQDELRYNLSGKDQLFWKYPLTCIEIFEGKPLVDLGDKYEEVMEAYRGITIDPALPKAAEWKKRVWDKLSFDIVKDYFAANQLGYDEFVSVEFEQAMREHYDLLEHLGWLNKPVYTGDFADGTNKLPKCSETVKERMYRIPPDENCEFVIGTGWEVENKDISFIYRRSAPLKPAWTVMAYGGGGTYGYHYERHRGQLTLREKARIQTFTDDFQFIGPGIRAQIGEAVPPLMAERIAREIRYALEKVSST